MGTNGRLTHEVVVYTAVFGERDEIIRPPDGNFDWVCFTDEDPAGRQGVVQTPFPMAGDIVRSARFFKTLPQLFFPNHRRWIWIDGSIAFHADPARLFSWRGPVAVFKHPIRDCIYDEAAAWMKEGNEDYNTVAQQMQEYRMAGFPEHAGLGATGVLIRDNIPAVLAFNNFWWSQISSKSRRDQLSFNFGMRKFGIPVEYIDGLHGDNAWFRVRGHKNRPIGASG